MDINTTVDLDPGIVRTTPNRRILSNTQLRNEIMFSRESSTRELVRANLFTTNQRSDAIETFNGVQDLHIAEGFSSLQFHYLINTAGFVYTGLELNQTSLLTENNNICIGLTGGLTADGKARTRDTLSSFSPAQIDSLINLLGQFAICYEKLRIERFPIDARQGAASMNAPVADIRNRVNKRFFNG